MTENKPTMMIIIGCYHSGKSTFINRLFTNKNEFYILKRYTDIPMKYYSQNIEEDTVHMTKEHIIEKIKNTRNKITWTSDGYNLLIDLDEIIENKNKVIVMSSSSTTWLKKLEDIRTNTDLLDDFNIYFHVLQFDEKEIESRIHNAIKIMNHRIAETEDENIIKNIKELRQRNYNRLKKLPNYRKKLEGVMDVIRKISKEKIV